MQPKGTEQQLKRSKKEGDRENFENTEEDETMVCYPHVTHHPWPQVKLRPLENISFLPGGQIHLESKKNNVLQEKFKQLREDSRSMLTEMEAIDEQKRCVETAMNDLLEHLEEEKAKTEQMKIEMDQQTSALEQLHEGKKNLQSEIEEEKVKKGQLEEDLRKAG